jgi:ABC-type lipoprotein release transport system permease subunit
MALGAVPGQVRSLVLRQGLRLAGIGLLAGVPIAVPLALALRSLLLVTPFDAVSLVAVLVLLGGAAALASYLPARAASRVDPMLPLRES